MQIINEREVELTQREQTAKVQYEHLLDRGYTVLTAAARAEELNPGLDPAFYRWLRNESLMPTAIGASDDTTKDYREMTAAELSQPSFSDYFRFSFTARMDRDEALVLAAKVEAFVNENARIAGVASRDTRVYVGVLNRKEAT